MTFKRCFAARAAGLLVAFVAVCGAGAATAETCTPPIAPSPLGLAPLVKPRMPQKPACSASNRCRQADVNTYNAAIEKYNSALFRYNDDYEAASAKANAYVAQLNMYRANVDGYTNCEHKRLVETMDASDGAP
jgi:hypothetical protein